MSKAKNVLIGLGSLFVVGAIASAGDSPTNKSQTGDATNAALSSQSQSVDTTKQSKINTVEKKTETKTEAIPYESVTQNDNTVASGQTSVTGGVDGVRTITYEVTYTNGTETSRTQTSSVITMQPVTKVTKVGTKVASSGSSCSGGYINSVGNCVQSPGDSPSGATAQCKDGTYSYSQSRSGTCSHHGGVATWL